MEHLEIQNLIGKAIEAKNTAYAPYSHFQVGAALLCKDGTVVCGCNIENASYGATNCAERTAFFKGVSEGKKEFQAIAIVGGKERESITDYAYPCGICRQVMKEFCRGDFVIIIAKSIEEYEIYSLEELLPHGFGGEAIV